MNNFLYFSLDNHVPLKEFDNLHLSICSGLAKSRKNSQTANLRVDPKQIVKSNQFTHLSEVYKSFYEASTNSELKQHARDLTFDELAYYLKFALGGYDLYQTYFIYDNQEHFGKLCQWIENLKTQNIFKEIHKAYILTLDAGGIPFEHFHYADQPVEEFIHVRPKISRPFYVRDPIEDKKVYMQTRVNWWNTRLKHGGDKMMKPSYTVRIDGKFTDYIKSKINFNYAGT